MPLLVTIEMLEQLPPGFYSLGENSEMDHVARVSDKPETIEYVKLGINPDAWIRGDGMAVVTGWGIKRQCQATSDS